MGAMTVGEVMNRVPSLQETATLRQAVEMVFADKQPYIPILCGQTVVGILTENDVRRALPEVLEGLSTNEYHVALGTKTVSTVMSRNVITVTPNTLLAAAVEQLLSVPYTCLPVTNDGKLVGLLTKTDCLRALASLLTETANNSQSHMLM